MKNARNTSMIGGTIAVPSSGSGGTMMDNMDISCRSDLTQDLNPEDYQLSSSGRSGRHPRSIHRPSYMEMCQESSLRPTILKSDVTGSSHNSYHTATNFRSSDLCLEDITSQSISGEEDEVMDPNEDSNSMLAELDEAAENAARAVFGGEADKKLSEDDAPPRRSTLVCENSTIDPSWFAARGLMSRRSFERYQKELKSKVIAGASSNNNLRGMSKRRSNRRSSISMCDLRKNIVPTSSSPVSEVVVTNIQNLPAAPMLKKGLPPKPRSVDAGLDDLMNSFAPNNDTEDPHHNSVDESLDQLVKSFIDAFKKGDQEQGSKTMKSKLANNKDLITNSLISKEKDDDSGLNLVEIEVLSNMIRRLSQENEDRPYQNDVIDNVSIQDEIIKPNGNTMKRDCSMDDLMDSLTWESNKPGVEDIMKTSDLDQDTDSNSSIDSFIKADIKSSLASAQQRLTQSVKTVEINNRSESDSVVVESASNENLRDLKFKYMPKRNSSTNLMEMAKPIVGTVDFDDSFRTARGGMERNDTLSSNMISEPGDGSQDKENRHDESASTLSSSPNKFERSRTADDDLLPPRNKHFERHDTRDTLSTLSPTSPSDVQTFRHQTSREERQDASSTTDALVLPMLERVQSTISLNTMAAVMPTTELARDDSSISTMSTTLPFKIDGRQSLEISQNFERGKSHGTDCAVVDMRDKLDRFEKASNDLNMTFGANNFPDQGRPSRRHSPCTLSSSANQASYPRQRSLSSTFSAPMDLMDNLEGPPLKENCGDILEEGMKYLSKAMLVNVYAKLRELSMLGHASVKLADIDVNSHQSLARKKEMKRLGLLPESKEDNKESYLDNTKTAGAVVRTVLDEYEMFKESSELSTGFSQANHLYDASLLSEFKTWVEESKTKQLDSVTYQVIKTLREECARRQIMVKDNSNSKSNDSLSAMEKAGAAKEESPRRPISRRRDFLSEKRPSFQDSMWLKQEQTLIADHFSRGGAKLSDSMIGETLDKSHDYFEEGSTLRNLLETGLEVVWHSDRHPDDIIYCICVNRETSTVTVVFRGQESFVDLLKDTAKSEYPNPILHEDYEGNAEFINLRAATSDEMMRVRRDTKKSTIDEIRDKVARIGRELTDGGRFHLSVTGHSKGGGLATIAGFYLASDPSLELASAVRVFTFASSRVGCKAFQQGFKHLEQTGRLELARFTTSNEVLPLLPMWDGYHHVGMQICLHKANSAGRQRIRQSLDVSYDSHVSRIGEAFQFARSCFTTNKSSRISEYQHRMHFAREYRLALGDGVLRFDKKRNHLKSLNDYYLMKCRLVDYCNLGFKTKNTGEASLMTSSWLIFFLVSCFISFEIALLFKFVATW